MQGIRSKYGYYRIIAVLLVALLTAFIAIELIFNGSKISSSSLIKIVPHPQEIGFKGGLYDFTIDSNTVIVIKDNPDVNDETACEVLNAAINSRGLPTLDVIRVSHFERKENGIIIGDLNSNHGLLDSLVASRQMLSTPPDMKAEEYRLDVDSTFIVLVGKDKAAVFFGVQTIIQLFKKSNQSGQCKVTAVKIRDFPDMPIRSTYYGFHLKNLDNDSLLECGYNDILKFAKYKFNMIGLDNHHYSHLEMEIPDGSGEKYWQRFAEIFEFSRKYHLQPRVGGWTRWFDKKPSAWNDDLTMLEGIRTTQTITMTGTQQYPLRISSGHLAKKVIYDFKTGKSWSKEPVIVTDESGQNVYEEGIDYQIDFGYFNNPYYDKVIFEEGEPAGFPLRRGESFDAPTQIRRTQNSRIKDGQRVEVSFSYIGPDPWSLHKIRYCRSDPRIHIDGPENFIWRWCTQPITYLEAKIFNLEMDEIRVFGWDKRCRDSGKSRSQIFADDIKYYYDTIRKKAPDAQIFMWSDMIDPNHNATTYTTQEVADLLIDYGMSDIIMVPWNHKFAEKSIEFSVKKGFPVMASSQAREGKISLAPMWAKILRKKFKNTDKLYGLMHAPWEYDYATDDGWERLETAADHAWSVAPYIIHLPVQKARQGEDIVITADYDGDEYIFDGHQVRKGPLPLISAHLCFRKHGNSKFRRIKMSKNENQYSAKIPGTVVTPFGIEYFIEMSDKFNTSFSPKSAPEFSYKILIY